MWTCVKCGQTVDDSQTVCPHCGASRSAGRFSRGIQARQTPRAQYVPEAAPVKAGRGFLILGSLLALLLPTLTIALAVILRHDLTGQIYHALHPDELTIVNSDTAANVLYWALAAGAALLSALPGIGTAGIGKMLRRLARIEQNL